MTEKDLIKEIARELKKLMEIKSLKETKSELEVIKKDIDGIWWMSFILYILLLIILGCVIAIIIDLW